MYEFDQESGCLMVPEEEAGDVMECIQEEEENADMAEDFGFSPEESFSSEPPMQGMFGDKIGGRLAALRDRLGGGEGASKGGKLASKAGSAGGGIGKLAGGKAAALAANVPSFGGKAAAKMGKRVG